MYGLHKISVSEGDKYMMKKVRVVSLARIMYAVILSKSLSKKKTKINTVYNCQVAKLEAP